MATARAITFSPLPNAHSASVLSQQMVPPSTQFLSQEPGLLASSLFCCLTSNQGQSPLDPASTLSSLSLSALMSQGVATSGPRHLDPNPCAAGHQLWDLRLTSSLLSDPQLPHIEDRFLAFHTFNKH